MSGGSGAETARCTAAQLSGASVGLFRLSEFLSDDVWPVSAQLVCRRHGAHVRTGRPRLQHENPRCSRPVRDAC